MAAVARAGARRSRPAPDRRRPGAALAAGAGLTAPATRAARPGGPPADPAAAPARIAAGPEYDRCLDTVGTDPEAAAAFARGWIDRGGGVPATHCLALARLGLGDPSGAAGLLDRLARDETVAPATRATIAAQAAQAWMIAGEFEPARSVAGVAIALAPADPGPLVLRATAALRTGRAPDAVADLTEALRLEPDRTDARVLRATAYRSEGSFGPAAADVARALAADPDDPAALLERGVLRQHDGDLDGARSDFERVLALSPPDTQTAELAQQDIALLEAGPDLR